MNETKKHCFMGFKLFDGISEVLQPNKMIQVKGDRIENVGSACGRSHKNYIAVKTARSALDNAPSR